MPLLRADAALNVGDNEPYAVSEATDWTIPEHGEGRGIPHVGIEIRQDLVGRPEGQRLWAERLAPLFVAAAARLEEAGVLGAYPTALLQD
jgi:predicted N-formylglutamate amidohydrolase